jgi:succinyl-diaminopimelate desuccinylase
MSLEKLVSEARKSDEVVKLARELLRINSESETAQIQNFVKDFLKSVGAKVETHSVNGKTFAVTSVTGENKKHALILYAHSDVVPSGDTKRWSYPPYDATVVGDKIYARGASDMKGALASELFVYSLLVQNDVTLSKPVSFVCVPDEENWVKTPTGWGVSKWLLETGRVIGKCCIMGEPSGLSKICIGERGDYWIKLMCESTPRHGSAPLYEENACVKLFRALEKVHSAIKSVKANTPAEIKEIVEQSYELISEDLKIPVSQLGAILEQPSMNVGVVKGGDMINIVPAHCEAQVAFCVPLGMSWMELHELVSRVASQNDVKIDVIENAQSNPSHTSPKAQVVSHLKKAVEQTLSLTPKLYVTQATSDANVFRAYGIDTCFYGPGEMSVIHAYDEWISVEALKKSVEIYLRAVLNYAL